MDGYEVMTMDEACTLGDIFVTTTGCCDVITAKHMLKMKNLAIVCNIGHFDSELKRRHAEISLGGNQAAGASHLDEEKQVHPDAGGGRLVNLGCATGHRALS